MTLNLGRHVFLNVAIINLKLSLEGSIVSHVYVVLPASLAHTLHFASFISDLVLYTILNIHTLFRLHNRFVLSLYVIE